MISLRSKGSSVQTARTGAIAEIDALTVTFPGGVRAVRGISLAIGAGEIVGLVGESGSGKSVLGLSLLGLLAPTAQVSGRATVAGVDMVHTPEDLRQAVRKRHLGAVFQDPMTSLNPTMRVGPQVAEAIGRGATREAVVQLLEHAGVPEPGRRLRQYPHELSGGLRQRVMIAMAVAGPPSLVIADEPTTALDVTVQAQVLRLMARLRDETRSAFLLITHDLGVAAAAADRIAVMYAGRIVELGNARDVLNAPDHPYTRALLDVRLRPHSPRERPLPSVPGEPPNPRDVVDGCAFAPRCPLAAAECWTSTPQLTDARRHEGLVACHRAGESGPVAAPDAATWSTARTSAAASEPPALLMNDVAKTFRVRGVSGGRIAALRGVTLTVDARAAMAIVGESGCGKSTLLRVAAGLVPRDAGAVELDGPRPQMVFQDAGASLTPWLKVGDLLHERLALAHVPKDERIDRLHDTMTRVGLARDVLVKRPRELSGGQRQRIAIARAVIVPPRLLLCDEPISALDASLSAQVLNLLGRLRRELGLALLFVTHDLAAARVISDEIAVMYAGRIVEQGPSDEVLNHPLHPYTRTLLDSLPETALSTEAVSGTAEPGPPAGSGCRYRTRCPLAQASCEADEPLLLHAHSRRFVACPIVGGG